MTKIPLRIMALASNVLFSVYGYLDGLYPVMTLHLVLFPVNLVRLVEVRRLLHELDSLPPSDLSIQSWVPHMTLRCLGEGQTLVRRGDKAERIFYLLDGQVELPELGKVVRPGTVLGEIGVFGPDQKRTETMVCRTDCRFYELTGNQAMQLCFQDRKFGLVMLKLVIDRLIENNRRMLDAAAREPAEECRRAGP